MALPPRGGDGCDHPRGAGSETPEGPGWLCLVILLAAYIAADKSGLLHQWGLGAELQADGAAAEGPGLHAHGPGNAATPELPLLAEQVDVLLAAGSSGWPASRALSASSGSANSTDDAGHGTHSHPHEAMFFLVGAIMVSTLIMHLNMRFKSIQQTVVLFVVGCVMSLVMQGFHLDDKLGPIGRSYSMWMVIDPHLLLFTLLPPLLAGDAMTIDTSVVKKVANQCLYLAGPGVAINAGLTALFLKVYLPYDWPFLLCLTTGAILCATDPVAVVALLKELGASPTLTVQIQGESLLNDGTAIVLYTVSYNMLKGDHYGPGDVVIFLVKTALYAWILGMMIGAFFYFWIRAAKNKLDHNSSLIQVSLTIACAYCSFIIAEGLFHISGVLSTVAASLVLAHKMWPEVVSHETMHTIWHVLEYLGNTIIFFLAGALTGSMMVRIPWADYIHLISIYLALLLIRTGLIVLSRPLLRYLSAERREVPLPDALVMSWGGLRGAVGLALAIQVSIDQAGGELSASSADKVLFYVGGVALLTLAVNATTCPALVKKLGITQTPEVKVKLMLMLHNQLKELLGMQARPQPVRKAITAMLDDVEHHLQPHVEVDKSRTGGNDSVEEERQGTTASSLSVGVATSIGGAATDHQLTRFYGKGRATLKPVGGATSSGTGHRGSVLDRIAYKDTAGIGPERIIKDVTTAKRRFEGIDERIRCHLTKLLSPNPLAEQFDDMTQVLREEKVDKGLARAVNEAFLALLRSQYWRQIEHSEVTTDEAEPLLMSITAELSTPCWDLNDFRHICPEIVWPQDTATGHDLYVEWSEVFFEEAQEHSEEQDTTCIHRTVESTVFNTLIILTILANSVFVFVEDTYGRSDSRAVWLATEVYFTMVFTAEFLLRFADLHCRYFCDAWNLFDFVLVGLGWVTVILNFMTLGDDSTSDAGGETQVARSVKVLKVLRAIRLVRLIKVTQVIIANITNQHKRLEVAEHMKKFEILFHFIQARIAAQNELVRYFGRGNRASSGELARCILQSKVALYEAMAICAYEAQRLKPWLLEETHVCHASIEATAELEEFIIGARDGGVLSETEAEALIHTMNDHIKRLERRIVDMRCGHADEPEYIDKPPDSDTAWSAPAALALEVVDPPAPEKPPAGGSAAGGTGSTASGGAGAAEEGRKVTTMGSWVGTTSSQEKDLFGSIELSPLASGPGKAPAEAPPAEAPPAEALQAQAPPGEPAAKAKGQRKTRAPTLPRTDASAVVVPTGAPATAEAAEAVGLAVPTPKRNKVSKKAPAAKSASRLAAPGSSASGRKTLDKEGKLDDKRRLLDGSSNESSAGTGISRKSSLPKAAVGQPPKREKGEKE